MPRKSVAGVQRQVNQFDPPIEVGQYWSIKTKTDGVLRRVRILAQHPFPPFAEKGRAWITEEQTATMNKHGEKRLTVWPEYNLRYVLDLERTN